MKTYKVFQVYETNPFIKAKAVFIDGFYSDVKLLCRIPRGQYYSVLNDAGLEAERLFQ